MRSPAPGEVMDITNMLNKKGGVAAQQFADPHQHHHLSLIKPEPGHMGMERSASPHGSEHSQYSNPHSMSRSYPSPSAMQVPLHMQGMPSMHMSHFADMSGMGAVQHMTMQQMPQQQQLQPQPQQVEQTQQGQPAKAYPCSNCNKAFARRSDLARHERIHSGVRPHVCDWAGCKKQFIQRSALTVHQRTHTGEKPHQCEICAKPFSDSSSLARHRRTHSGTRPYKCPYADCQKTFTRRTTLTRHQNHHSGTVEEAAATTAAALAAKGKGISQARSESDHMSNQGSPMTTPSPAQRNMSMSPSMDLSAPNGLNRHSGDFQYMPAHLRVGSPASTSSNGYNTGIRPTSHPTGYGPPPILEPNLEQHQAGPGSAGGSPHMSNVGWQSPVHAASPGQNAVNSYVFPDPDSYNTNPAAMGQIYYRGIPSGPRAPSAEPGLMHMA